MRRPLDNSRPSAKELQVIEQQLLALEQEFAAEEEMLRHANCSPYVRPSLQSEFLCEVEIQDWKREQLRNLPMTLAFLVVMSLSLFTSSKPLPNEVSAVQHQRRNLLSMPLPMVSSPSLNTAMSDADSWALVDAFRDQRQQKLQQINRGGVRAIE